MGKYFADFTDRAMEYSEFVPRKIKVAIPCFDMEGGGYKLAICKIAYLADGLPISKLGGWFFKSHGVNNINNKLPKDLAGFDPICSARPTVNAIRHAVSASDVEWQGGVDRHRLFGFIGSAMLTLLQGGYVVYGKHYCQLPKGRDGLLPAFRLTEIEELVDWDNTPFLRTHPYRRTIIRVLED